MTIANISIDIIRGLQTALGLFFCFRIVFFIVGVFATRKFAPAKRQHRYAVLVAARNEEAVIGNLLESFRAQDYPQELFTVFVVADNCTDNTAAVVRQHGAVCYERQDPEHRTKGYALQYLLQCIRRDYDASVFEGYFIFDADNLLKADYISRMNDAFDAGEKIISSYRNTKNLDDNWISASYALHWIRTIRTENRARSFLHLATRIQGTGYLLAAELLADGWNCVTLSEDRELCVAAVIQGYRISYNDAAEFYDEQPTDLRIAMRQRIRWAKGHLINFKMMGWGLVKGIFKNIRSLQGFVCYDVLTIAFPHALVSVFCQWSLIFLTLGVSIASNDPPGTTALLLLGALTSFLTSYGGTILVGLYVFLFEHKRMQRIPWYKTIWYCLTFPLFDTIGRIANCIALVTRVEWKPIPHKANVSIQQMQSSVAASEDTAPEHEEVREPALTK